MPSEGEAISLVCVDEHKLLRDIERLLKREIPKTVLPGYDPDPSIKAEPIHKGRNNNKGNRTRQHTVGRHRHDTVNSRAKPQQRRH